MTTHEQMDLPVEFRRIRFLFETGRVVDIVLSRDDSNVRASVLKMTGEARIVGSADLGVVATVRWTGAVVGTAEDEEPAEAGTAKKAPGAAKAPAAKKAPAPAKAPAKKAGLAKAVADAKKAPAPKATHTEDEEPAEAPTKRRVRKAS